MTDRDAKHPSGPLPRDADGRLILKREPDGEGFTVGEHGVCRVRVGYAEETSAKPERLYHWRCVEAPVPAGCDGEPWVLYRINGVRSANTTWFNIRFERVSEYELLLERLRAMPEPSKREREAQALSFAYGNVRLGEIESTRDDTGLRAVSRAVFAKLATEHYGWTAKEFDEWADACRADGTPSREWAP